MRSIDAQQITADEIRTLLKKPAFDEVVLGEGAQKKIEATFGKKMTAEEVVEEIVTAIRREGNEAVFRYTKMIDGADLTADTMEVSEAEFEAAMAKADPLVVASIEKAIANVRSFHEEQLPKSWITYREKGAVLGQNVLPIERVGIYVPGGTASYPSSVIMNAVPAKVAGVSEIVMTVPPARDGSVNEYVLVAARLAGVTRVFKLGGAQAVGALAFGTETVPKVDKITGPGNIFVTLAKKAVYGHTDIDMLAGPSEILILADETADPVYVAADMLSQAEHDVLASSMVITTCADLIPKIEAEVERQLGELPRQEIARASLDKNGMIVLASSREEAAQLANICAPEHLEVLMQDPFMMLPLLKNAGAIFLGAYSSEPLGDYLAGTNHVLPTGGTARFYSALNVETFMKKTSIIAYTQEALADVCDDIIRLAEAEGLGAHANAIRVRGRR